MFDSDETQVSKVDDGQVDLALEKLARAISHDLREPLVIAQQFSEMLIAEYGQQLDPRGRDWLERVHRNVRRSQQMVQALREFSTVRIEPERMEDVDLNRCIPSIIERIQLEYQVQLKWLGELLPVVKADSVLMSRLISELIANAVQHGQQDALTISAIPISDQDRAGIELTDNGHGIASRLLPEVTQLFVTSNPQSHLGVGLAYARKIMQLHQGALEIRSAGVGTQVRLWWPKSR